MGFTFKNFHITQDKAAMKVGTDGVLLGAWAQGGMRILDIGTGTGLIALMMAQRFPQAHIDAIEVDPKALEDAHVNIESSPFHDRIKLIHSSLQYYKPSLFPPNVDNVYDAIISNPPYFINSLKNPLQERTVARHTVTLTPKELLQHASHLLKDEGILSLIIPSDNKVIIESEAILCGLSTTKIINIKTKPSKSPKRCMIEFKKILSSLIKEEHVTLTQDNGERSEWYHQLTKEFYIK